jgi:hypothetical protein
VATISIREAVKEFQVSRPTLTKALNNGKVSGKKDDSGTWMMEASEISRVYKPRTPSPDKEHVKISDKNSDEHHYMKGKLEALESYVDDLKEQRNKAESRADAAEARVTALLSNQSTKRRGWWPWGK